MPLSLGFAQDLRLVNTIQKPSGLCKELKSNISTKVIELEDIISYYAKKHHLVLYLSNTLYYAGK